MQKLGTPLVAAAAVFGVLLLTGAQAQQVLRQHEGQLAQRGFDTASDLIGTRVDDQQGNNLGSVADLVVDPQTGKVAYVVLSRGGVLGVGAKLYPIPWQAARYDSQKDHFIVNLSESQLNSAPSFGRDSWPDLSSATWRQKIQSYYQGQGMGMGGSTGMSASQRLFDPGSIETVSGRITSVSISSADPGLQQIMLKADDGRTLLVDLAPQSYLQSRDFNFDVGDKVSVRGSLVQHAGKDMLIATQMRTEGGQIQLRTSQGRPLWQGQMQQAPSQDLDRQGPGSSSGHQYQDGGDEGNAQFVEYDVSGTATPQDASREPAMSEEPRSSYTPQDQGMDGSQGASPNREMFDPNNMQTVKGTVTGLSTDGVSGNVVATVNNKQGDVMVTLAPNSYLKGRGVDLKTGDKVTVYGSQVGHAGESMIIATSIKTGWWHSVGVRDKQGQPLWTSHHGTGGSMGNSSSGYQPHSAIPNDGDFTRLVVFQQDVQTVQMDTSDQGMASGQLIRASKLVDKPLQNQQGQRIGTLDNLVIDLSTGKADYAVVGSGGVLGMRENLHAVPWDALHFNADRQSFALDASKEKLENAPTFKRGNWPDFSDRAWQSQIDRYFGVQSPEGELRGQPMNQPSGGRSMQQY